MRDESPQPRGHGHGHHHGHHGHRTPHAQPHQHQRAAGTPAPAAEQKAGAAQEKVDDMEQRLNSEIGTIRSQIAQLNGSLNEALDNGDEMAAQQLAAKVAQHKKQEKAKQAELAAYLKSKAESVKLQVKLDNIAAITEERRAEIAGLHAQVRHHMQHGFPDGTIEKLNKAVRNNIVQLEQHCLVVDGIELNEGSALRANRKAAIQTIQKLLRFLDDLNKHLTSLPQFMTFLQESDALFVDLMAAPGGLHHAAAGAAPAAAAAANRSAHRAGPGGAAADMRD